MRYKPVRALTPDHLSFVAKVGTKVAMRYKPVRALTRPLNANIAPSPSSP